MTHFFEFLQSILDRSDESPDASDVVVSVSAANIQWIREYLRSPDFYINFKATAMPDTQDEERIYSQHYEIKGEHADIFGLLTEAMVQNPHFASVVGAATEFFYHHASQCKQCEKAFTSVDPNKPANWQFLKHQTTENGATEPTIKP